MMNDTHWHRCNAPSPAKRGRVGVGVVMAFYTPSPTLPRFAGGGALRG
jgi:hypothetical protein